VTGRVELRVPLRFALEHGEPTHAPMVLVAIGACHTRLVLDTGSDVHLLTRETAEAAGLALGAIDAGTDHAGAAVSSWLVGEVPIRFTEATEGSASRRLADVIAIPAPAAFVRDGIGGILSPQRLDLAAFAILDEIDDELLLVDGTATEVAAVLRRRHTDAPILELFRRVTADVPIVDAAIEPYPAMPFLLNSGSSHVELDADHLPGLAAGPIERTGAGVSGAAILGAPGGAQVLRVGERRIALASVILRRDMGDPPAMLGQDVLRGTVLAVGPDPGTVVLWQVPTSVDAMPRGARPAPPGPARGV
jgi:hypothetical protein